MPQLLPFFYVNQISFRFIGLFILIYFISIYIIPAFLELFITRIFLIKVLFY